jgi:hypothetical protein
MRHGRCLDHLRLLDEHPFADFYRTERWRRTSKDYRRRHPICEHPGCTKASAETDHIVSLTDGGAPFDEGNLQALCHRHHDEKTWADRRRRQGRVG